MNETKPARWDCHVHVIGSIKKWPLAPTRGYDPQHAPLKALFKHMDALKIDQAVVVQPSVYGFDNGCLLDALKRGEGRLSGVVVPAPDSPIALLEEMHASGVRGIRCNVINPGGLSLEQSRIWWPWMIDRGWNLQLQINAANAVFPHVIATAGMPPVVIDHMGCPPPGTAPEAMTPLVEAVRSGRVYVKLSAPYRISAFGPPHGDAIDLAQRLLEANAAQCLWASDWPHTDVSEDIIGDADWLERIEALAGTNADLMKKAAVDLYQTAT